MSSFVPGEPYWDPGPKIERCSNRCGTLLTNENRRGTMCVECYEWYEVTFGDDPDYDKTE
jgi:hypothetical protein